MQCYLPENSTVRIIDTLQHIPKAFAFLKTTIDNYLQQEIGDIISIIKYPPKTPRFLSYDDATKNSINQIAQILQRSISQPRIQILLLPPMLPQSQNENLQPPEITSIPAPDPRVEPVSQPPRVQIQDSSPIPPPIDQPYTSPSLYPIPLI